MKRKFSSKWIASKKPRKQRKYKANAPLHTKHKFLSAHLSKSLRQKYGKRSLPLRKEDEVLVMRGRFKKKQSKIISVNLKKGTVALEGLQATKRDGTKVSVPINPRVLQIISLNTDDRKRLKQQKVKSEVVAKKETNKGDKK